MSWLWNFLSGITPSFSEDREQFCPPYINPCVSKPLAKKVSIRMRMAAARAPKGTSGNPGVIWVPEQHYTYDVDTKRSNVLRDVRDIMDEPEVDRIVLLGMAPSWCTNEVTDPQWGGFLLSIEQLFCGVAPHPQVAELARRYEQALCHAEALESSKIQNPGPPHPDDTGEIQLFVQPGQRGDFDDIHRVVYTARALSKGVSEFGGYEDVLLKPASYPTLRDAIAHDQLQNYDKEGENIEPVEYRRVETPDTHGAVENDNNDLDPTRDPLMANEVEVYDAEPGQETHITLDVSKRDVVEPDHELFGMDHPMWTFLNEFGETLRKDKALYRSDVTPVDKNRHPIKVRQKMHLLPDMFRVSKAGLERIRKWLYARIYRKIRYTRLTRTGLRVLMPVEGQSRALYELYKNVLLNRPEEAPCITLILHVEYMLIRPSDRKEQLKNKAAI